MYTRATANPSNAFIQIQPPIGSRVRMSAFGKRKYDDRDCNPYNQIGTIYNTSMPHVIDPANKHKLDISVEWDNGQTNGYNIAHLDIIAIPFKVGDRVAISPYGTGLEVEGLMIARPEFLKAAYKAACSEWKEKLVKEYPDFEFLRKERTYKSGDTICIDTAWGPTDYAIVHSDRDQIILVNKTGFAPWTAAIVVTDHNNITVAELNKIVGAHTTWHGKVTDTRVAK